MAGWLRRDPAPAIPVRNQREHADHRRGDHQAKRAPAGKQETEEQQSDYGQSGD
jgi:hypothetical protein